VDTSTSGKHFGFAISLIAAVCLGGCGGGNSAPQGTGSNAAQQHAGGPSKTVGSGALQSLPRAPGQESSLAQEQGASDGDNAAGDKQNPNQAALLGGAPTHAQQGGPGKSAGEDSAAKGSQQAPLPSAGHGHGVNGLPLVNGPAKSPVQAALGSHKAQIHDAFVKAHSYEDQVLVPKHPAPQYVKQANAKPAERHPEFNHDLQHDPITVVHGLSTAGVPKHGSEHSGIESVAMANALLQIVVHDREYAARLAYPNKVLERVKTVTGRPGPAVFRRFYWNYEGSWNYRVAAQTEMFEILQQLAGFNRPWFTAASAAWHLAQAVGRDGLTLPYHWIGPTGFGGARLTEAATQHALAGLAESMVHELRNQDRHAVISVRFGQPNPAQGQVQAVTRAFVIETPLSFDALPLRDRIESFVIGNVNGNFAAFIRTPGQNGPGSGWSMVHGDTVLQVADTPAAVNAAIGSFNRLLPETHDDAAIMMVVYADE
jgi:hypothetical protein